MASQAETIHTNLRAAMKAYSCVAGGDYQESGCLALSSCGINYSVFNSAMLRSPVRDLGQLHDAVQQSIQFFASRQLRWTFWLCLDALPPEMLPKVNAQLQSLGLRLLTEAPGMATEALAEPQQIVSSLVCRPVIDAKTRFDFCDVACVVFALPFRISYSIYAEPGYWQSGTHGHVAYLGQKPVAIASTVLAGDALGVYSLGTLPQHRRNGYGETLMRYALRQVQQTSDQQNLILQATQTGLPLYKRLGYRTVTQFRVYEHAGCNLG